MLEEFSAANIFARSLRVQVVHAAGYGDVELLVFKF
jgi:hypothetical protein